jgi:hypothetical protein
MPKEETNIEKDPGETQATDLDETKVTEPLTYKMPDGRELTAEQIAEALKSKENETKWRRENEEKGRLINEARRRQDEELTKMKDEFSSLKESLNQPKSEPRKSWRDEEDSEKRTNLFYEEISGRVSSMEKGNRDFREGLTTTQKANDVKRVDEQFQILADDTLDKLEGVPDDPDLRDVINASMGLELGRIGKQNWTPEAFKRAAQKALDSYNKVKALGQDELIVKKKKDKNLKTGSPGSASAPGKKKITPGMSKAERDKILFAEAPEE